MRIQCSIGDRISASLSSDSLNVCLHTVHIPAATVQRHPQSSRPELMPILQTPSDTSVRAARLQVLLPGGLAPGLRLEIC